MKFESQVDRFLGQIVDISRSKIVKIRIRV
jgi:hypothetical protein